MIIDAHNHVLAAGLYPGYERFIKEMTMGYFQSRGSLPEERDPEDEDWRGLEYLWEPIDPETLIRDHTGVGVDMCTILAVAPSEYTRYETRGTVDVAGVTGIEGPPSIDAISYGPSFSPMLSVTGAGPPFCNLQNSTALLRYAATMNGL